MVLVPAGEFLVGKKKEPEPCPPFLHRTVSDQRGLSGFLPGDRTCLARGIRGGQIRLPGGGTSRWTMRASLRSGPGKHSPSTREWEKAARGTAGWLYPWGNEKEPGRATRTWTTPAATGSDGAAYAGALRHVRELSRAPGKIRVRRSSTVRMGVSLHDLEIPRLAHDSAGAFNFPEALDPKICDVRPDHPPIDAKTPPSASAA